jgi:hypothetical protein
MTAGADRWIRWTTTGCVALLALIAGTVSYPHMHLLVELHGQPGWVAALTPLSVDGMIAAASTTLLADSRAGSRGGVLPWALLVVGSAASLAANVAVAQPTAARRLIAAWPSFALIGAYERWRRLVKGAGAAGEFDGSGKPGEPGLRLAQPQLHRPQANNRRHPCRVPFPGLLLPFKGAERTIRYCSVPRTARTRMTGGPLRMAAGLLWFFCFSG